MNLCLITSSYPLNPRDAQAAAGFFVRDFAIELYQAGHNIYILTQQKEGPVEDAEGLKVIRYKWAKEARPLSRLNPFNPRDILSRILPLIKNGERALLDLIRREKIDFCLAMWAIPAGYLTYLGHKKLKIPYAVYCLGSDIWDYGKNPLFLPLLKNILDNTQSLFADGRQLALDVEKISKNKCRFLASSRVLPISPAEITLEKNKTHFLFIGRYHKNKGPDTLIEAVKLIPRELLEKIHFHLFGGGELEDSLRAKIKEYNLENTVSLGGFIDAQKSSGYLSACACLIIPSRIESIPVILSDGLQAGIPLIVSDTGDMGKLVGEYNAGKVVRPQDPQGLKDAIVELLREDRNKYSAGIKELRNVFNLKKNVSDFLETITQ